MNTELFINWNPIDKIGPIHSYSLCWAIGLLLAYLTVSYLFYDQKIAVRTFVKNGKKEEENIFDPLFIYCFIGILVGARLGHCLFYERDYFLSSGEHIVEMLLPIKFTGDGDWHFTGYAGLASHGGTLGLMIALVIYVWRYKIWDILWNVLDNIAIATGVTACFIRLGNLMNSEIIGKVTDVPWAFIFERGDGLPRHPGQLYEAIAYIALYGIMLLLYKYLGKNGRIRVGSGWYFGFCLTFIFTFRFFIEYTKEVQEDWEADMILNMGQRLSIPFVLLGVWCMVRSRRK